MKKAIISLILLWYGVNSLYAQGDDYFGEQESFYQASEILKNPTVQPPNVAAFQKVHFVPVSNYTGRAQVSIPIFNIKSGNISVPISLTYNSSGVKVNDIPSSVGSNWSLNAGGKVSKVVKGLDDFYAPDVSGFSIDTWSVHAAPAGWLLRKYIDRKKYSIDGLTDWNDDNDPQPDVFMVSAPGVNTEYTHTIAGEASIPFSLGSGGDIFELTGQKNKITETIKRFNFSTGIKSNIDGLLQSHEILCVDNIKVTSLNGNEYEFGVYDVSEYTYNESVFNFNTGTLNAPRTQKNRKVEAYHLTKIKDIKSNKEVTFEYEKYVQSSYDPINDSNGITGSTTPFQADSKIDAISTTYLQLHRLKKINYGGGSVEFVYGLTRQDVTSDKALTQVIVKDLNGVVIKKVNLQYNYFTNSSYTSTPQNKRLRLDKVYTTNASNEALPGYVLTYSATKLPPRGAWGQDFLGYHNGSYNTSNTNPKPHIYFYPDSGRESVLPVSKGSGYYLVSGNFSLASNLTYAKAGILEKIQYPTGGFSEFEYELNQFKVGSGTINGGGLRIKSQKIKDELGNEQLLDYEYKETDNTSSGGIVSFSNYIDLKVVNGYTPPISPSSALSYYSFKVYNTSQAQAELTKGSFVGYSRVVVKDRISNGYTEYVYASPKSTPDVLPTRIDASYKYADKQKALAAIRNGIHKYNVSNELKRGNLLFKKIYDKGGVLKVKEENQFTYKKFGSIDYVHNIKLSNSWNDYNSRGYYEGAYIKETVSIPNERYLLTKSITTNYLEGGNTSVTKETIYDATYPLVKENKIVDNTKTVLNKYYYPHDLQVSSLSYMSSLRTQNRYSEMIQQEAYHDGQKIFTERINYTNFGNGLYLPNKIYTAKGTQSLEEGAVIDKRDAYGNVLQYHTKEGVYTSFIYGYGNTSLLAKIENEKYDVAVSKLPVTITALQSLDSESSKDTLLGYFNTMRSALPNARIISYTYIPSVGVQTITDNRGKTMSYVYDKYQRLSLVKDTEEKIVKRYEYNYKNQ